MFKKNRRFNIFKKSSAEHEPDRGLLYTMGGLIVFGLVVLSSASAVTSYAKFGSSYHYFNRQILFLLIGAICFYIFSKIDYRFWKRHAFAFLGFSCLLLLLVFIPGLAAGHGSAASWIKIFGFSLQPSEFVKIFFLIYLAAWLESRRKELHDFKQGIGPFIIVLFIIALLMILQPDIGTLFIIASTSLVIYFIGGGKMSHIFIIVLLASISIFVMAYIMPYQMDRFKCVLEKDFGLQEECYQLNQSLIAVGSGGFFGRGLGQSRQKFLYLPEVSSDSIFAVIAEEIGFVFSSIFFILYLTLFYKGIKIAKYAPDDFGRLLATGIVSWFIIQTFLNIGGVIGMIPMTGVPLPFVSQGGSSLISALIAFGILVNISKQTKLIRT